MFLRALVLQCPRCGGRAWIVRWFRRLERCRTCGYLVQRQPGFSLGAITMNIIVTFFLLAVVLAVGIVATYPDLPVGPMTAIGLAVALVAPIVLFPVSQTTWAALDLAMHPLEPAEQADAAAHAATGINSTGAEPEDP